MSTITPEFGYSYEYGLDIKSGDTWLPFRFPTGINPQVSSVTEDAATYDDLGAPHQVKLSESWTADFSVQQQRLADGKYLPEIEALRALTEPDATGSLAVGTFRWYDKPASGIPNPDDAFEGEATVQVNRGNTGNAGIGAWSITLTGVGRRRKIANPWTGWPASAVEETPGEETGV